MTDRDRLRPPLDERSLRDQLIGAGSGWRQLDVVAQTGSTNADLLARAASGADIDGVVLIAEHQTAGRGRHGRGWAATARAQIILSVGVRVVDVPVQAWGWLSLAAGLAVLDSVAPLIAVPPAETGLKWPNDVLARGGKLAGILAEVAQPFVVLGVGLNVTQAPEEVDPDATSLLDLGVAAPDRKPHSQQAVARARSSDHPVAQRQPTTGGRLPCSQPDHWVARARRAPRWPGRRRDRA